MITLEVRHAELIEGLTKQTADAGITNGAIVSPIGAVDSFTLTMLFVSASGGASGSRMGREVQEQPLSVFG